MAGITTWNKPLGLFTPFFCKGTLFIQDSRSLKSTQFGAVGGQIWSFGGEPGFTPQLIRHSLHSWQLSNCSAR
eukprot:1160330-Pelagomonas_calceolata.AAC.1